VHPKAHLLLPKRNSAKKNFGFILNKKRKLEHPKQDASSLSYSLFLMKKTASTTTMAATTPTKA
jgi:hypothetical protein